MTTYAAGDDECRGSPEDRDGQWDYAPTSGEGLASALKRLKQQEKARAMLQGGASDGRTSERDGPSTQ